MVDLLSEGTSVWTHTMLAGVIFTLLGRVLALLVTDELLVEDEFELLFRGVVLALLGHELDNLSQLTIGNRIIHYKL